MRTFTVFTLLTAFMLSACGDYEEPLPMPGADSFPLLDRGQLPDPIISISKDSILWMDAQQTKRWGKGYYGDDVVTETDSALLVHFRSNLGWSGVSRRLIRLDKKVPRIQVFDDAIDTYTFFSDQKVTARKDIPLSSPDNRRILRVWAYQYSNGTKVNLREALHNAFPDSIIADIRPTSWKGDLIDANVTIVQSLIQQTDSWGFPKERRLYTVRFDMSRQASPEFLGGQVGGAKPDTVGLPALKRRFVYNSLEVEIDSLITIYQLEADNGRRLLRQFDYENQPQSSPDRRYLAFRQVKWVKTFFGPARTKHLFLLDLEDGSLSPLDMIPGANSSGLAAFHPTKPVMLYRANLDNTYLLLWHLHERKSYRITGYSQELSFVGWTNKDMSSRLPGERE